MFFDENIENTAGIMRTPEGTIISCYELHDLESVSAIKYDCLSVEGADKIHICLDLLIKDGLIKPEPTLKETYMKYLGIYNIDRTSPEMWDMVNKGKILSLFQMEQQSGIRGIRLAHPQSVEDLAHLNSIIRLMAPEKGMETPLEKYARFKENIKYWYQEMDEWGLTKDEQKILEPIIGSSYGICEAQEQFMQLVQIPECGGFDLDFADRLRKSIAKKDPAGYERITEEYFKTIEEKHLSKNLCNYVWRCLVATSRGYGFNLAHTLGYSLVALQEMNLAYYYPTIYWNTACLIVNSGSTENASTDYGKMARALNSTIAAGIKISLVNINQSDFGFIPDAKNNQILFGMKGLLNVGDEVIAEIIEKRPYASIKDFYNKAHPKKQTMISLIKSGAFDAMEDRKFAMAWYVWETCDKKKRITLQNMPGLIEYNLLPLESEEQKIAYRVYEFNRYLKTSCLSKEYYLLDERGISFLTELGQEQLIDIENSNYIISTKKWNKCYQKWMDVFRDWIAANKEDILLQLNSKIFYADWCKYAQGTLSDWEMEVMCFYYHPHVLKDVNKEKYGISNFYDLPIEPIIEKTFTKGTYTINIYKLNKICGTCIAKDKAKGIVTILTPDGVVNVKMRKEYLSLFDKRISEIGADGIKHIKEKSWFERGSMIVVQGFRSQGEFILKKYASSPSHQLYKIVDILPNGDITLQHDRQKGELEDE